MIVVRDKFGTEIFPGSLVAVATNSGMYVGRVIKFNTLEASDGTEYLTSFQVQLTTGRKQSYDGPQWRCINLDEIHNSVKDMV